MNLQKHIKEIMITLTVISITTATYAALTTVSSGSTLTSTIWNDMVNIVNQNEAKLTNVSNVGGNIGIGTVSPTSKLHVNGGNIPLRLERDGISTWDIPLDADRMYFKSVNSSNFVLTLNKNGNVGIGTTTPTKKLDIAGTIKATSFDLGLENVSNTCVVASAADACLATCPAGKYIVSGGCNSTTTTNYLRHNYALNNTQWQCKINTDGGSVTARALCGNITPW